MSNIGLDIFEEEAIKLIKLEKITCLIKNIEIDRVNTCELKPDISFGCPQE